MSNSFSETLEQQRIRVEIPSAEDISLSSAEEIYGYGRLLISQFRNLDGFSGLVSSPLLFIRSNAASLLQRIRRGWSRRSAVEMQMLLAIAAPLRTIAAEAPGNRWDTEVMARLYGRMLVGEKVSLSMMMTELRRLHPAPAQQRWYRSVRQAWIEEAMQEQPFSRHSDAEAIEIIRFLLSDPLPELSDKASEVKERLKSHLLSIAARPGSLRSERKLQALAAALPALRTPEARQLYQKTLRLLGRSSRINKYLRQSYLLDLVYEN